MTHHKLPEVSMRMARIEGHVKGIRKMVDEAKDYSEIMHQIMAVRAALDGVVAIIVDDLIEHVTESPDTKRKQAASELKKTVSKLI